MIDDKISINFNVGDNLYPHLEPLDSNCNNNMKYMVNIKYCTIYFRNFYLNFKLQRLKNETFLS